MKHCEKCNKTYDDQDQYCSLCGTPLTTKSLPDTVPKKFCGQCGAGIEVETATCPSCGALLENDKPIMKSLEKEQKKTKEKMSLLKNILKLIFGVIVVVLFLSGVGTIPCIVILALGSMVSSFLD